MPDALRSVREYRFLTGRCWHANVPVPANSELYGDEEVIDEDVDDDEEEEEEEQEEDAY
jgi:hypothetical protein